MRVLTGLDDLPAGEFFWLDLVSPTLDDLERLGDQLGLHPAAVEDSREWDQLPKTDDYGDHLLIVFFTAERTNGVTRPREVHVYLSGGWVMTVRRCETAFDRLHDRMRSEDPVEEDLIVYRLLDALADGWDPVVDALDARVDELEVEVLDRPQRDHPRAIYWMKQEVQDLLRHAARQASVMPDAVDAMHRLPGLRHGSREWLRDVTTHCESIASDLNRISADLSSLTDTYFNANANRLNRLVTYVSVGSVFFLLWTLVTGFFGQNFGWLVDHIDSKGAFIGYELGALVIPTVVLALILWRRRRDWL